MDGSQTEEIDIQSGPDGLYECKYPGTVCNNSKPINLDVTFFNVESIKTLQIGAFDMKKNSCAKNAGCEHFCLLNSSGSASCACPFGSKPLEEDPKQCAVVELQRPRRQGGDYIYDLYHPQSTMPPPPQPFNNEYQFLPMYILYPIGK